MDYLNNHKYYLESIAELIKVPSSIDQQTENDKIRCSLKYAKIDIKDSGKLQREH